MDTLAKTQRIRQLGYFAGALQETINTMSDAQEGFEHQANALQLTSAMFAGIALDLTDPPKARHGSTGSFVIAATMPDQGPHVGLTESELIAVCETLSRDLKATIHNNAPAVTALRAKLMVDLAVLMDNARSTASMLFAEMNAGV